MATNNGYQNAPKFSISRNKIPKFSGAELYILPPQTIPVFTRYAPAGRRVGPLQSKILRTPVYCIIPDMAVTEQEQLDLLNTQQRSADDVHTRTARDKAHSSLSFDF